MKQQLGEPRNDSNPFRRGEGGFLAFYDCGCTAGWTADVAGTNGADLLAWLAAGCTIVPLSAGQSFKQTDCARHGGKNLDPFVRHFVEALNLSNPVVHILKAGTALCGAGVPESWPPGTRWIGYDLPKRSIEPRATCNGCRVVQGLPIRPAGPVE
jgi:hypothetical protein